MLFSGIPLLTTCATSTCKYLVLDSGYDIANVTWIGYDWRGALISIQYPTEKIGV